ncbi:DUF4169 family protein [Oceanicaulis sp.]|jgi:hypothetical protein|uniref:DUF4169 family protein n=1 Tax=Oceanicaulis sp. TaxID=1924941 RepID=UPI000D30F509
MTQPINLRQARKQKARADKAKQAEINRVQFGAPKAQRDLEKAREAKRQAALEAHKRDADKGSQDS